MLNIILQQNRLRDESLSSSKSTKRKRSPESGKENQPYDNIRHPSKKFHATYVDGETPSAVEEVKHNYRAVENSLVQAIKVNQEVCENVLSVLRGVTDSGYEPSGPM